MHIDAGVHGDHAFGLFDRDPACQRMLELTSANLGAPRKAAERRAIEIDGTVSPPS